MSGEIAGAVWEMDLPQKQKYILLAYADHADKDGYAVCPGYNRIAWKTGTTKRHVMRIVAQLEAIGVMVVIKPGGSKQDGTLGRPNLWRIDIEAAPQNEPIKKRESIPPGGDQADTPMRVTKQSREGDQADTPMRVTKQSPDPSLQPSDSKTKDSDTHSDSFSESADPIPEIVTPYSLIDGMFKGMPSTVRPALISYSSKDLEVARGLVAQGYTADRIAAYVAWAYEIDGWLQKGKDGLPIKIWMARIAEKIAAYEAAVTPKVKATSQILEDYEPEYCEQCGGLLQFERCYVCEAEPKPDYSSIPQAVMDCWRTTWAQIGLQLGKTAATGFMSRIKPLKMVGNTLVLTTSDSESKWWFDKHLFHSFMDTYNQIARAVGGGGTTVELVLQEDTCLVRTK